MWDSGRIEVGVAADDELDMISAKFMILRTTSPQPESLTFAKLISLTNYKAFPLTFSKLMAFAVTFALTMTRP